ncbi:hypothetical protein, partial [Rhodococcus sp. MEB064]|uniref:hypothetical protein n=1 Tax=Rhodococcus sp. MEB064 TaxID=1587522 RepID=UPI0018CEB137
MTLGRRRTVVYAGGGRGEELALDAVAEGVASGVVVGSSSVTVGSVVTGAGSGAGAGAGAGGAGGGGAAAVVRGTTAGARVGTAGAGTPGTTVGNP